jgi:Zn ribbon nucleic-acid-binding protein
MLDFSFDPAACLPACLPVHMQVWRLVQVESVGCLAHHPDQTWNDQVGAHTRRQTLHHRLSQVLQESLWRDCSSECSWGRVEECQKVHQQQLTHWASPSLSLPLWGACPHLLQFLCPVWLIHLAVGFQCNRTISSGVTTTTWTCERELESRLLHHERGTDFHAYQASWN